jgi:hypothetical protein
MAMYFYDEQIKRFLLQFARIFSDWQVLYGTDANGNPIYHRVPIQYGDSSRQAATIIANNSASNLPSTPMITYYISGFEYDQKRTQDPTFLDKMNVRQRTVNPETGEYETTQGNAFTVERLMPVPYTLRVTVDIWASNTKQKLEIVEQLSALFNPGLEIQSTDNFIDWSSLSVVFQDGLGWTSRSIPVGNGNPIDILSWKFYMPIWISSPIKVRKMGVIQKIIASIYKGSAVDDIQDDDLLLGTRQKITPYGYQVLLLGNRLQLLPQNESPVPPNSSLETNSELNTAVYWEAALNAYGVVKPGISMIALENPYLETEIMGTISYDPGDARMLIYDIDADTIPQNTLGPVDSIIDPTIKWPDEGLPPAAWGQRYLIVEDIPEQAPYPGPGGEPRPWAGLTDGASANDIIEYGVTGWVVSFNSNSLTDIQYVRNNTSGVQYRFLVGEGWSKSIDGFYSGGEWRIVI